MASTETQTPKRNHRNDRNKITKPPKQNNKITETSNKISQERVMYVIYRSFVLVALVVTFVSAVSFRCFGF